MPHLVASRTRDPLLDQRILTSQGHNRVGKSSSLLARTSRDLDCHQRSMVQDMTSLEGHTLAVAARSCCPLAADMPHLLVSRNLHLLVQDRVSPQRDTGLG